MTFYGADWPSLGFEGGFHGSIRLGLSVRRWRKRERQLLLDSESSCIHESHNQIRRSDNAFVRCGLIETGCSTLPFFGGWGIHGCLSWGFSRIPAAVRRLRVRW
jgi:hypothetical protein